MRGGGAAREVREGIAVGVGVRVGVGAIGAGAVQRLPERDALGEHHVHGAAGIDLDHRKDLLGQRDVVLGEPVERAAHPGSQAGLQLLARVHRAGGAGAATKGTKFLSDRAESELG